jgi:predicted HicB family RNase H-like nuclease
MDILEGTDGSETVETTEGSQTEEVSERDAILAQLHEGKAPAPAKPAATDEPDVAAFLRKRNNQLRDGEALRKAQERERLADEKSKEAERLKAEVEQERRELRENFKKRPVETFKKLDMASEDILLALAEDGTPERKQKEYLHTLEERLTKVQKQLEEAEAVRNKQREEQESSRARQQTEDVHQKFVTLADPEKFPNARAIWESPREILRAGYEVVEEYQELCRKKNIEPEPCTDEDIMLVLEQRAEKKLASLRSKFSTAKPTNNVSKPKETLRTLNGVAGSERRSTPKNFESLSEDEKRETLLAAAKEALMASTG